MTDQTYNGWTNYATWRVNIEVLHGIDPREYFDGAQDVKQLSSMVEDFVEELVLSTAGGLAADYAAAFLDEVDYFQIAWHMACDNDLFFEEEEEA